MCYEHYMQLGLQLSTMIMKIVIFIEKKNAISKIPFNSVHCVFCLVFAK